MHSFDCRHASACTRGSRSSTVAATGFIALVGHRDGKEEDGGEVAREKEGERNKRRRYLMLISNQNDLRTM